MAICGAGIHLYVEGGNQCLGATGWNRLFVRRQTLVFSSFIEKTKISVNVEKTLTVFVVLARFRLSVLIMP
jgi:hypothetical protein